MKPKSMVQDGQSQQGSWSWLDRVQTKLESLYETEQAGSVFLQETGRMLETQVTKVGANVKKLYSDFVRELLLPLEVPGESQAWADAQARLKAPAVAGGEEKALGGDQPAAEEEGEMVDREGDGQKRDSGAQAEEDAQAASVLSASGSQESEEFEVLAPPLFQAPPLEETHEDLRVKEGVTKLHLKLQEMERIGSGRSLAAQEDSLATHIAEAPVVHFVQTEPEPESKVGSGRELGTKSAVQSLPQDAQPLDKARAEAPGAIPSVPVADSAHADLTTDSVPAGLSAGSVPLDVAAESDAAELDFASETEGECARRDDDDLLSGNESDRSQRAKWYGAKAALSRAGSGVSTEGESGKGGWFDWELV